MATPGRDVRHQRNPVSDPALDPRCSGLLRPQEVWRIRIINFGGFLSADRIDKHAQEDYDRHPHAMRRTRASAAGCGGGTTAAKPTGRDPPCLFPPRSPPGQGRRSVFARLRHGRWFGESRITHQPAALRAGTPHRVCPDGVIALRMLSPMRSADGNSEVDYFVFRRRTACNGKQARTLIQRRSETGFR